MYLAFVSSFSRHIQSDESNSIQRIKPRSQHMNKQTSASEYERVKTFVYWCRSKWDIKMFMIMIFVSKVFRFVCVCMCFVVIDKILFINDSLFGDFKAKRKRKFIEYDWSKAIITIIMKSNACSKSYRLCENGSTALTITKYSNGTMEIE